MTDKATPSASVKPSDKMQHIVFEGCDCIVMAPEDYDQLERELAEAERLGRGWHQAYLDENAKRKASLPSSSAGIDWKAKYEAAHAEALRLADLLAKADPKWGSPMHLNAAVRASELKQQEFAWLIEANTVTPVYYTGESYQSGMWTSNALGAVRYPSKAAAECAINRFVLYDPEVAGFRNVRAEQHGFIYTPSASERITDNDTLNGLSGPGIRKT
jgi:hypothetical protein